jgi:hypothetical protein
VGGSRRDRQSDGLEQTMTRGIVSGSTVSCRPGRAADDPDRRPINPGTRAARSSTAAAPSSGSTRSSPKRRTRLASHCDSTPARRSSRDLRESGA